MRTVRTWLPWAIAVWLGCQALVLVSVPIGFAHAVAAMDDDSCCPGLGPGQVCPMHHSKTSSRGCRLTNACSPPSAALFALLGVVGLSPEPARAIVPQPRSAAPARIDSLPASTLRIPDSPPPRV